MSKLFDTLEKIQQQEGHSPRQEQVSHPAAAARTGRFIPLLAGLILIMALVAGWKYLPWPTTDPADQSAGPPQTKHAATPLSVRMSTSNDAQEQRVDEPEQMIHFNDHGVALANKGETWTALYYFNKASKLAPQQPEPLINMAILLARMELGFPAARFFRQAHALAPQNKALLAAMDLAVNNQLIPPDFQETRTITAREER